MTPILPLHRQNWIFTGLTVWFMTAVVTKALGQAGDWLIKFGPVGYAGYAMVPLGMGLVSFTTAFGFLRKYGYEQERETKLKILYPLLLGIQGALSVLLILAIAKFPPGGWIYALVAGGQFLAGTILAYYAVELAVKRLDQALHKTNDSRSEVA